MAGCECDKENFLISYNEEMRTLTAANPLFSPHERRVQVAQRLRPGFQADMTSAKTENLNLEEYDGPEFIFTEEGEVYYPSHDRTEEEMQQRRQTLKPQEYAPEDHQTTRLIRESFRLGATRVVTSYYRPGEDHRDIIEMTLDPLTRKGKMHIRNAASDGNLHNFSQIQEIAKREFSGLSETKATEHVFILSDKLLSKEIVREVVAQISTDPVSKPESTNGPHQQLESKTKVDILIQQTDGQKQVSSLEKSARPQVVDHVSKTVEYAGKNVWRDTKDTIRDLGELIRDKDRRQAIRDHLGGIFGKKLERQEARDTSQSERLTLTKIRKEPENLQETIGKRHTEMRKTAATLGFVAETNVALGAMPLLLASLTKESPKSIKAVEKSIARNRKKELKRQKRLEKTKMKAVLKTKSQEQRIQEPQKIQEKKLEKKGKRRKEKKLRSKQLNEQKVFVFGETVKKKEKKARRIRKEGRKEVRVHTRKETRRFEAKPLRKEMRPNERRARRRVEHARAKKRETLAWTKLTRLAKSIERASLKPKFKEKKQRVVRYKEVIASREIGRVQKQTNETSTSSKERRREAPRRFAFAWLLWVMLSSQRTPAQSVPERVQGEKGVEALVSQEPTQWVLLSIIWYLSMVRESGNPTNTTNKQIRQIKKKKDNGFSKKSMIRPLAPTGVIFAFRS